jgi:hypothetical protein
MFDGCWLSDSMQKIEEAAEKGELTELVLMVIWNRLDLARRDVSGYIFYIYFFGL